MKASSPSRLAAAWDFAAKTSTSLALLFAAANGLAALLLAAGVGEPPPGALQYGIERLRPAYPELTDEEIRRLLREFWTRPYVYEPYTQFREDAFAGRYLNLRPEGFRWAGHDQPWPPDPARYNVFVFGGSTTMGYGVADDQTLPARLESALGAGPCGASTAVYNFARSSYFSTQERILFQQLVLAGAVPDVAVFVDGLNEFAYPTGEPKFTKRLSHFMTETEPQLARRLLVRLPLARLLKGLRGHQEESSASPADPARLGEEVAQRWLGNLRQIVAVAESLGIETLFVWQPVAAYQAASSANPFLDGPGEEWPNREALVAGYRLLDRLRATDEPLLGRYLLWLADQQAGRGEALYVDRVHYSADFTRHLAERLAPAVGQALCGAR